MKFNQQRQVWTDPFIDNVLNIIIWHFGNSKILHNFLNSLALEKNNCEFLSWLLFNNCITLRILYWYATRSYSQCSVCREDRCVQVSPANMTKPENIINLQDERWECLNSAGRSSSIIDNTFSGPYSGKGSNVNPKVLWKILHSTHTALQDIKCQGLGCSSRQFGGQMVTTVKHEGPLKTSKGSATEGTVYTDSDFWILAKSTNAVMVTGEPPSVCGPSLFTFQRYIVTHCDNHHKSF